MEFGEGLAEVAEVAEGVAHGEKVEVVCGEGEVFADALDGGDAQGMDGAVHHAGAWVEADDLGRVAGDGDFSRATRPVPTATSRTFILGARPARRRAWRRYHRPEPRERSARCGHSRGRRRRTSGGGRSAWCWRPGNSARVGCGGRVVAVTDIWLECIRERVRGKGEAGLAGGSGERYNTFEMADELEFRPVVIAPTFNNARTLEGVLRGVGEIATAVIVVNDGSTDGTAEILQRWAGGGVERVVLTHEVNRGKAAALWLGFERALALGFSHAVTIDTDGQLNPGEIPTLLKTAEAAGGARGWVS